MGMINKFGKTAIGLSGNPLGIIALFIVLIYAFAALVVGVNNTLESNEKMPLIWFMVIFPLIVIIIFSWLVSKHYEKLYAPKDFSDNKYFLSGLINRDNKFETVEEIKSIIEQGLKKTIINYQTREYNSNNKLFESYGISSNIKIESDLIFLLTPFDRKYERQINVIKKACNDLGLRCVRGDEEVVNTNIFVHILKLIQKANAIITILDGKNPNVFYELGIAHAMNKNVFHIAQSINKVPFDLSYKSFSTWATEQELYINTQNFVSNIIDNKVNTNATDIQP
jgi:lysophospholipid acyltransferase (LPLAT)-like uncharacterized protein